jgi:microtubule-associated protein-like 6
MLDANGKEAGNIDPATQDFSDSVKGRSVAVSHDGSKIVVGFKDGTIRVYDENLKQTNLIKAAKKWV